MKHIKYILNDNTFCYTCTCSGVESDQSLHMVFSIKNKKKPTVASIITRLPGLKIIDWYPEDVSQPEAFAWEKLQQDANDEIHIK